MTIAEELNEQLDPKHIRPPPRGKFGDYIEAHHAIREANRIFGWDGWSRITEPDLIGSFEDGEGYWHAFYSARCTITVYCEQFEVNRQGHGNGSGKSKDMGSAHESALKEAESDAMKRALMTFGDPFGLALYDKEKAHVAAAWPDGPFKNKTAAKKHWREVMPDLIKECWSVQEVNDLLKENSKAIEQTLGAGDEMASWIEGDGEDWEGIKPVAIARRETLDGPLGILLAGMLEQNTPAALREWSEKGPTLEYAESLPETEAGEYAIKLDEQIKAIDSAATTEAG